jgi:hypothetical protein
MLAGLGFTYNNFIQNLAMELEIPVYSVIDGKQYLTKINSRNC